MTCRVDFYHDAPDRLEVAARIAQKAHAAGQRLLVVAPDATIRSTFDRHLWTFSTLSFVPHCLESHRLAGETPVVLSASTIPPGHDDMPEFDVLMNLGATLPEHYERFPRVIEIVSQSDDDRGPARDRFRAYKSSGHDVNSHRMGERG